MILERINFLSSMKRMSSVKSSIEENYNFLVSKEFIDIVKDYGKSFSERIFMPFSVLNHMD